MYYKICETISSEQNLFVIIYIAGLNYCQHLQTRSSLALSQGRWWHTMVVTDCSVLVTGGLYSDTVHPTKCLTVSTSPPPLVNICYKQINQEFDFHLRSKTLCELPPGLLYELL